MLHEEDDREVMTRYSEGTDAAALEVLYRKHHSGLLRFLAGLARNSALAEDLAQQTWLKIMDAARRGRYTSDLRCSFRSWLLTVARNTFFDECTRKHQYSRSVAVSPQMLNALPDESAQGPEQALQSLQATRLLRAALASLPVEQSDVLRRWSEGASIDAMAEHACAPRDTVLSRKKYGCVRLRRDLEQRGAGALAF